MGVGRVGGCVVVGWEGGRELCVYSLVFLFGYIFWVVEGMGSCGGGFGIRDLEFINFIVVLRLGDWCMVWFLLVIF